jgi:hypothetical protein
VPDNEATTTLPAIRSDFHDRRHLNTTVDTSVAGTTTLDYWAQVPSAQWLRTTRSVFIPPPGNDNPASSTPSAVNDNDPIATTTATSATQAAFHAISNRPTSGVTQLGIDFGRKTFLAAHAGSPEAGMQRDELTAGRDLLLGRLSQLHPVAKRARGYRTVCQLLGKGFALASASTQVALLQAASFMIDVLEKLPPS